MGTTFLEDNWDKDIIGIEDLQSFLEQENVSTLYAIVEEINDNKRLRFFRTVSTVFSKIFRILFEIDTQSD